MLSTKSQIKVILIGKDGIARKHWVDHDAEFYDSRYKLDQEAIYQSQEGWWIFSKSVPTIMFRENSVIAISHRVKATVPDPDEMGSSISRAAWAIAELMRKGNENMQVMLLVAVIACCVIAGAGAFLSYNTGKQVNDLKVQIADLNIQIQTYSTNTTQPSNNGLPIPLPVYTPIPTPVRTPVPAISIT